MSTDHRPEAPGNATVLMVLGEDPWQDPTGGMMTCAQTTLRACGDVIAVASPCEAPRPEGIWSWRQFEDRELAHFSFGSLGLVSGQKPLIPAKIHVFWRIRKYMKTLNDSGPHNLLLDCAEALFCAQAFPWKSLCFRFPGLNNPVANSRYPWARIFGGLYERLLIRSLLAVQPAAILAAADEHAINAFRNGPGRRLDPRVLHSFPTRVDPRLFFPQPRGAAREALNLEPGDTVLVANGRLNQVKGWQLLLEVLENLMALEGGARLIFVGDGEDHPKILDQAKRMGLEQQVTITGFVPQSTVRTYLCAADVVVVGSHMEGWSLAMLEALACGRPLVSTDVSGACALIREGHNGFIIRDRDPHRFAHAVRQALTLPAAAQVSLEIADRYSVETLAADLGRVWAPLDRRPNHHP